MSSIEHYLALVQPIIAQYGYAAVFMTIFVESFAIPAPGESMLIGGSLLAARGDLHILPVLLLGWSAAILGDNLAYALGRYGGRRLVLRVGINARHLQRVEDFFARYGGGVVAAARFFEGLRQLNGFVAGIVEMPWWRFFAYNVLGATLWVGLWGLGAYFLDRYLRVVLDAFKRIEPLVVAIGMIGIVALVLYLFQRRGDTKPGS